MTMHVRMKSANGTFDGAAAHIKTNLLSLLAGIMPNTFRWDKIIGLTENLTPPVAGEYVTGFPLVGTQATDELPHQLACVVSQKTAFAGRSYRGRHYIPAISEAQVTAGQLTGTYTTAVQQYYDDLVAGIGAAGANADYTWVVWSEKLDIATPVTQAIVRANPGVVRRRRVGVGQ